MTPERTSRRTEDIDIKASGVTKKPRPRRRGRSLSINEA
jgi:hypothetical protein